MEELRYPNKESTVDQQPFTMKLVMVKIKISNKNKK